MKRLADERRGFMVSILMTAQIIISRVTLFKVLISNTTCTTYGEGRLYFIYSWIPNYLSFVLQCAMLLLFVVAFVSVFHKAFSRVS